MSFFQNFILFLSPIFGLVIGSFLNVVIYRTEKNLTFKGRSFCPKCKKQLLWYDNIPLLSFLLLKGKCRFCQKKISLKYPLLEFICGLFFLLIAYFVFNNFLNNFFNHFFSISGFYSLFYKNFNKITSFSDASFLIKIFEIIFLWILFSTLLSIFIYDLKHLLIPDAYTIFGIAIVLLFNFISDIFFFATILVKNNNDLILRVADFSNRNLAKFSLPDVSSFLGFSSEEFRSKAIHLKSLFSSSETMVDGFSNLVGGGHPYFSLFLEGRMGQGLVAGLLLAGFFFFLVHVSNETWMGKGDIKIAFLMGIFLGLNKTFFAAMLAFEIGAIFGISLILLKKARMKTALPFGPFLIIGTVLALFLR